jgi:hypothetical protein
MAHHVHRTAQLDPWVLISEGWYKQPGDPARAAEAVIKALQSPTPPRHLVLGHAGFDNVENQLRSLLQEADLWKATSLGADYTAV